eukprot:333898-Prymnesium_polylepis.1
MAVLQGDATDAQELSRLVSAIRHGTAARAQLVNRRRDGTPFTNSLSVHPVRRPDPHMRAHVTPRDSSW